MTAMTKALPCLTFAKILETISIDGNKYFRLKFIEWKTYPRSVILEQQAEYFHIHIVTCGQQVYLWLFPSVQREDLWMQTPLGSPRNDCPG